MLDFNGNEPKEIRYNNNNVAKVVCNGIVVWKGLPSTYTRLQYIESTGTQYIDTGYVANNTTKYIFKFMQMQYNGGVTIGNLGTTSNNYHRFFLTGGRIYLDFNGAYSRLYKEFDNLLNNIHYYEIGNRYVKDLNTNEYLLQASEIGQFTSVKNTFIGQASSDCKLKIYSCKIHDNNTLVRNFIPARRNSDNEIGLYDTVNDVFYTNQGTGTFVAGEYNQD